MSRIRIEGYLAAFPKLVGTGKQHTYIDIENLHYVYQPIESLYLLLVTNKQSNILDELETLRLLSKLMLGIDIIDVFFCEDTVNAYEEGIGKTAFEILFAFDEFISLGHKENVTLVQVQQYCDMESHEEKLHKLVLQSKINETKDVKKHKASEIDKSKSMGSGRIDTGFGSDMNMSNNVGDFGSGSGFRLTTDTESFSSKSKAFEILFAFDEFISLGHKENVTLVQVQQYCDMESHEEKLHKLVLQSKINETKDVKKHKASEIDKSKSMGSGRIDTGFGSDMNMSNNVGDFGSGSGFRLTTDTESFSSKSKGRPPSSTTAPPKGLGMKLGKTQRTNQFLEPLKAEGEVVLEDVRPSVRQSKPAAPPPTDPVTLTVEEKLNVTLKRDGGSSFLPFSNASYVLSNVNCWPSISVNETCVSMEYEASSMFDLQNVVICTSSAA
ncbi:coatomer subunit delta-like [Olea europaea subsp. europaea]|uniref:Coatomer subunit delta n=1 Tax=Olea europaea subsp. europaea TaxID=158383 RepID=A0A8S0UH78_OLEEU|nr:coatomer subunit delta-like [Olea europaea subsp. europaea]